METYSKSHKTLQFKFAFIVTVVIPIWAEVILRILATQQPGILALEVSPINNDSSVRGPQHKVFSTGPHDHCSRLVKINEASLRDNLQNLPSAYEATRHHQKMKYGADSQKCQNAINLTSGNFESDKSSVDAGNIQNNASS